LDAVDGAAVRAAPDPDGPLPDEAAGWVGTGTVRLMHGATAAASLHQLVHRGVVACRKTCNEYGQPVNEYPRDQVERWVAARDLHRATLIELARETANWRAGQGG
jgi:hypothetical protein